MTFPNLFLAYLATVAGATAIVAWIWLGSRWAVATLSLLAVWLAFTGWLGFTGIVGQRVDKFPPGIGLLTVPVLIVMLALVLSHTGAVLARRIPLSVLIGFQVYRVGVELSLHHLSSLGFAPKMMTLEGGNIEIIVAITAPLAAWLVSRGTTGRRIASLWNLVGTLSLANIVARAILTAPGLLGVIHAEPPDTAIVTFPFTFIPGFMAPLALALHILAFRALLPSTVPSSRRSTQNGLS